MEGRVVLKCAECSLTREIVGEIPDEYTRSFDDAVHQDGWVTRPGANDASLICRKCLMKYEGHETVDDEEKVQGKRDPMGVGMQAIVNRPMEGEMASPRETRSGFWAALRTLRKAIAEGIRPMTAIREFLSDALRFIAAITILILTVTVLVLVVSKSCTPAADTPATDTTATKTTTVTDTGGPPPGPAENLDGESQVTPVEGRDKHGRSATFDVFVWDQRFNWQIGQNASVELGGHPIVFGDHLAKPAIQNRMKKAQALIAVGSASQEIEETKEFEERRSDQRAGQLATWLEEAINKPAFTLSLGRHQGSKEDRALDTTRQRPIAVVGISACSDGVVMAEALSDALYRKDRAFPFDSQMYLRFELRPATLTCDRGIVR